MQFEFLSDGAQSERAKRQLAEFEKGRLFTRKAAGDIQQRFTTRLDAAQNPTCFLQMLTHVTGVFA